jgi:hypothetical protein
MEYHFQNSTFKNSISSKGSSIVRSEREMPQMDKVQIRNALDTPLLGAGRKELNGVAVG